CSLERPPSRTTTFTRRRGTRASRRRSRRGRRRGDDRRGGGGGSGRRPGRPVVVGAVVVGDAGAVVATSWPTVIVTVLPCLAFASGGGDSLSTMPSWLGSVTSSFTTTGKKPLCRRICTASACVFVVTSGTRAVPGPDETVSVTVEPLGAGTP